MRARLRTGIAIYNDGGYHAAHDAWEEYWLELESGTDDELLLHGLIQFTAAVYHATRANWAGVHGLAESGGAYLADLPADYRGVDLDPVRAYLARTAADPEHVERVGFPSLRHDGDAIRLDDLGPEATAIAATVIAEEQGYDEEPIKQATTYALADLDAGDEGSRFLSLLFDFVRRPAERGLVHQRLRQHVERRRTRDEDVSGLFGER